MSEKRERQPDEIERKPLPEGGTEERFRFGPYVLVHRTRSIKTSDPNDKALLHRFILEHLLKNALDRATAVLDGRLDPHEAAAWARQRLIERLQEILERDDQRDDLVHEGMCLYIGSYFTIRVLRELALAAARTRDRSGISLFTAGDQWPDVEALPPEIWCLMDLLLEMARMVGGLEEAELQAKEIVAGHRVRSGGRKAAAERQTIDTEERIAAWRRALAGRGRPERGRIKEVSEALARRFGTKPKTERKFYERHRADIIGTD